MNTPIKKEKITIPCADGTLLKGVLLIPEQVHAVVQFNGGTAVRKEYYLPFLEYICAHGYLCCLWDYRGSGESAPVSLKNCDYRFSDYGVKDMPAVKSYLRNRFSEYPLYVIAHSVGGQQLGFMDETKDIQGLIGFSVSTGYFKTMPWKYRLSCYYFFYLFGPLSIAIKGYVANKRFGYMEDLPKNVVREWGTWCHKPDYFFDTKFAGVSVPKGSFEQYTFPVHLYWATDDPIANSKSVATYLRHVRSTKTITTQEVVPEKYQVKAVGHMGFFRRQFKNTIWKEALNKLNEFSKHSQTTQTH
jgi:predicted alpha/beta hydrolase